MDLSQAIAGSRGSHPHREQALLKLDYVPESVGCDFFASWDPATPFDEGGEPDHESWDLTSFSTNAIYEGRIIYTPSSFLDLIPDNYKQKPISLYDPREAPLLNQYRLVVPRTRNILEVIQYMVLILLYGVFMAERDSTKFSKLELLFSIYSFGWCLEQFATILGHGWLVTSLLSLSMCCPYPNHVIQACVYPKPLVISRCHLPWHLRHISRVADSWLVHRGSRARGASSRCHGHSGTCGDSSSGFQSPLRQHGFPVTQSHDGRFCRPDCLVGLVLCGIPDFSAVAESGIS